MNMEKKQYIVPTLTVVEFKVEHGYGASNPAHALLGLDLFGGADDPDYNAQNQENWNDDNGQSIFSW